jgi:hypothetical protein
MMTNKSPKNANDPSSGTVTSDRERVDYLFECFKSAKEELLLRFKYREHWLEIQLLAQVVLLALSQGIQIGGAGTGARGAIPEVLALSPAISVILASLYFVDDSLITYIGNYLRAVTDAEATLRSGNWKILNWDSSKQVEAYVKSALNVKYVAQFIAFAVIPAGLFLFRISSFGPFDAWSGLQIMEVVIDIGFLLLISYLVLQSSRRRKDAFLRSRASILEPITPPNERA